MSSKDDVVIVSGVHTLSVNSVVRLKRFTAPIRVSSLSKYNLLNNQPLFERRTQK
jgi:hypothetical protein